jgi:hypothetical protein
MNGNLIVLAGRQVTVVVRDRDVAAASAALLRFGPPTEPLFRAAAASYTRAAAESLTCVAAWCDRFGPAVAYTRARSALAVQAAFAQIPGGVR